jgi:hypothetical protein
MRRLTAGLAAFGMLWGLAGCAGPPRQAAPPAGQAATAGAARPGATVKQRDHHLSGRHLDLAVYYPRTFRGRRYLAPEWHPVPYTRAVAAAAVGELLGAEPDCPGSRRPFPAGTRLQGTRLRDDRGQVMAQGYATAAEDAPGRGPFSAALTFPPGRPPRLDRGGLRGQRRGRQDRLLGPPPDLGGPLTSPLWTAGSPGPLGSATLPHRGTRRRRVRVRGARRWVRGARPGKSPTRRLGLRGTCASNPQPGRRCWTSPATTSTRAPEAVWTTRPPVAVRSTAVPTTGSVPMRSTRTCWPTVARRRR